MLPKELIRRIRRLEIRTRKVVSDLLAGQYHSIFKGRGMAFSEVRQYQPGDDIRSIDWNVTARMREPYVKVFTEERELTVLLVVDVSASKDFGSRERSKAEIAAEVAAQIAFSAIANNDRVGLVLFSDRIERVIPPKKGRTHVLRVVSEILSFKPVGRGTDLAGALNYVTGLQKRRAVTFVISDFLTDNFEKPLRIVARRHDLVPVVVSDPLEQELSRAGLVQLEDLESGRRLLVDLGDAAVQRIFTQTMSEAKAARQRAFRGMDLDFVELDAGGDYAGALVRFFRARARRLAA